jgi:hypothetical protein
MWSFVVRLVNSGPAIPSLVLLGVLYIRLLIWRSKQPF